MEKEGYSIDFCIAGESLLIFDLGIKMLIYLYVFFPGITIDGFKHACSVSSGHVFTTIFVPLTGGLNVPVLVGERTAFLKLYSLNVL